MKRLSIASLVWSFVCAALLAAEDALAAETDVVGKPRVATESLEGWQWFRQLQAPSHAPSRYYDYLLPPEVLDKARLDLGDLRLREADGKEVPFAVRVRRAEDVRRPIEAKQTNKGKEDWAAVVTLDLGEGKVEHNEIEIESGGRDFRRRLQLEGSNQPDKDWVTLLDKVDLVHFQIVTQLVDIRRFSYPTSQFRYLRLHVLPDRSKENDEPTIASASVFWMTTVPGLDVTLRASLDRRDDVRVDGEPGSAWSIEFDGYNVPCQQLTFDVFEDDFVRLYRLETASPNETHQVLSRGEWRRRSGEERKPMEIRLHQEVNARQLRLVVTDYRNPPLHINSAQYSAPARQLIFAASDDLTWPLKLYFGNPKADTADYDFARLLPDVLTSTPVRVQPAGVGVEENPVYRPTPKPWTERWPWLVYVVLGAASLVLLAILVMLGRQAIARHDAAMAPAASRGPTA
jgi:hypothetical protein